MKSSVDNAVPAAPKKQAPIPENNGSRCACDGNLVGAELDAARKKLDDRKQALVGAQQQKLKQESNKLLDNLRKKF